MPNITLIYKAEIYVGIPLNKYIKVVYLFEGRSSLQLEMNVTWLKLISTNMPTSSLY
jgi:hypothetical protein